MRAKKRQKAQKAQEEFLLDPYGRPMVVPLMGTEIVGEFEPRDEEEAKVYKNLGFEGVMRLREMKGAVRENRDKLAGSVIGAGAEAARLLPFVGEAIDAAELSTAFRTGKDLSGEEVNPELLAGLTAAGYLVPNVIERPAKALIDYGLKSIPDVAKLVKSGSVTNPARAKMYDMYGDLGGINESLGEISRYTTKVDEVSQAVREAIGNRPSDVGVGYDLNESDFAEWLFKNKPELLKSFDPSKGWQSLNSPEMNRAVQEFAGDYLTSFRGVQAIDEDQAAKYLLGTGGGGRRDFGEGIYTAADRRRAASYALGDNSGFVGEIQLAPKPSEVGYYNATDALNYLAKLRRSGDIVRSGQRGDRILNYPQTSTIRNIVRPSKASELSGTSVFYDPDAGYRGFVDVNYDRYDPEIAREALTGLEYNLQRAGMTPVYKKGGKIRAKKRNYKKEYKKFQSGGKAKKYRAALNRFNRKKGTYGNGDGLDASHSGGRIVGFEAEGRNRGRREKSRLKRNK